MIQHSFIFSPGIWLGLGKMAFSASPEVISFYTQWTISPMLDNLIKCEQHIEHQGGEEPVINLFSVTVTSPTTFNVAIKTHGSDNYVSGSGYTENRKIIWQFEEPEVKEVDIEPFIGFEVYTLQDNEEYQFHAEYLSGENFRTVVDGRIWKKE